VISSSQQEKKNFLERTTENYGRDPSAWEINALMPCQALTLSCDPSAARSEPGEDD